MRSVPVVSLSVDPDGFLNNKGLGVCAGTEEKLSNEIRKFADNPGLLKKMGQRTREYSIKNFSLDNFTKLLSFIS